MTKRCSVLLRREVCDVSEFPYLETSSGPERHSSTLGLYVVEPIQRISRQRNYSKELSTAKAQLIENRLAGLGLAFIELQNENLIEFLTNRTIDRLGSFLTLPFVHKNIAMCGLLHRHFAPTSCCMIEWQTALSFLNQYCTDMKLETTIKVK